VEKLNAAERPTPSLKTQFNHCLRSTVPWHIHEFPSAGAQYVCQAAVAKVISCMEAQNRTKTCAFALQQLTLWRAAVETHGEC
jgi:hypothetical protein